MLKSLLLSLAAVAVSYGQSRILCLVDAGTPALVRAEGVAERVSDVIFTCSGGAPGSQVTVSITLSLATVQRISGITPDRIP
jgi:uncharacterized metal-binding protein